MKKKINLLVAAGALMVFAGVAAIVLTNISAEKNLDAAVQTAEKIQQMLPPATAGLEDVYSSAEMAVFNVDGSDYAALIKTEKYGVMLPVKNVWNSRTLPECPQRFYGSCYSGDMVIGGSDSQLGLVTKLDIGDKITVTDMLGAEFDYSVARIDRSKTAGSEKLINEEYCLTIFARDSKTSDYIIVRCAKAV